MRKTSNQSKFDLKSSDHVVAVCHRCGTGFSKRAGSFPASYAEINRGVGFLPVCRQCLSDLYAKYLGETGDSKLAVRHICRKFDIYWSESLFLSSEKKSVANTVISEYIRRVCNVAYAGKSYDDTLKEEGRFEAQQGDVSYLGKQAIEEAVCQTNSAECNTTEDDKPPVPDSIKSFWGAGYSDDMYLILQKRYDQWVERLGGDTFVNGDTGTEALLRQICGLEIDINRERDAGRPADKYVTVLNNLLGSAKLKPVQKEDDNSAFECTPFGLWIDRWEHKRPIPETKCKDDGGLKKYITVWFYGHLCKMLGIKNHYCKLYEEEMEKWRVQVPEFDGTDDEFLAEALSSDSTRVDNDSSSSSSYSFSGGDS